MKEKFGEINFLNKEEKLSVSQEKESAPQEKKEESNFEKKDIIKERILDLLKKEEILQKIDGYNIFDLEKFLYSDFLSQLHNKYLGKDDYLGSPSDKKVYGNSRLIFEKLSNLNVVSKDDFEKNKKEGKEISEIPLFNIPESIEEAFDAEKIKNKKYYLNYWDIYGHSMPKKRVNFNYQIKARNGEKISAKELAFATIIFRDFQAKRDKEGNLLIFDKKTNEFRKISGHWLRENIGFFNFELINPRHFLLEECPNILDKELLKIEDFQMLTEKSGRIFRKEFFPQKNKPFLMIGSTRYYIGKDFFVFNKESIPIENIKIVELDSDTCGIVTNFKGKEELRFIFNLLSKEERQIKEKILRQKLKEKKINPSFISSRIIVGKQEMTSRIIPWSPSKDNPKRGDETFEQYTARIGKIKDYEFIKKVSDDFSKECQIGIHNLSWKEQQWLCSTAYELGIKGEKNYQKLLDFGKEYGLNGLKSFLTAEYDIKNSEKILDITKSIKKEDAEFIFKEYSKIIKVSEKFKKVFQQSQKIKESKVLPKELKDIFPQELQEAIFRRSKDLLMAFYPMVIEKKQTDLTPKDVLDALYSLRIFLEITSIFSEEDNKNYKIIKKENIDNKNFNFLIKDQKGLLYKLKIFVRPFEETITKDGKEYINQARINFELDFNTEKPNEYLKEAFRQIFYDKLKNKTKTLHVLRIGIDRDVVTEGDSERKISIDLGRSAFKGEKIERTGDVLGRVLQLTTETGHHNPNSFNQQFAKAEYFGEIAELFKNYLIEKCSESKSEME